MPAPSAARTARPASSGRSSERLGAATAGRAPDTSPETEAEASDRCSRMPAHVAREVARRGVALLRVLLHAPLDDPAEGRRNARVQLGDGLRLFPDDRGERLRRRPALERALARGHLVEHGAERELVRTEVELLAAGLLRRHVADRAEHGADLRRLGGREVRGFLLLRLQELGEAEVEDLDRPVLRDHDVFGLQVPVNDPGLVRLGEAVGHLVGEVEQALGRQRPGMEHLAQRLAVDELHRDVDRGLVGADVVDRDDVRVVQGGGRARLLLETLAAIDVRGELRREDLDGHVAPEARIARAIDLSHPSRAEGREDLEGPEAGAGGERHPWCRRILTRLT